MTANIGSFTSSIRDVLTDKADSFLQKLQPVQTSIGKVIELTGATHLYDEIKTTLSQSKHVTFIKESFLPILIVAVQVVKVANFVANEIKKTDVPIYLISAFHIISFLNVKDIYYDLKALPKMWREAEKIKEKIQVILRGGATAGKIVSTIGFVLDLVVVFMYAAKAGSHLIKLAPSMGAAGLTFSIFTSALKIWDLKKIFQFGAKIKKECSQQLVIQLETELRNKIENSSLGSKDQLLTKLNHSIEISRKINEKSLYKSIKKELSNNKVNYENLENLLDKLDPQEGFLLDLKKELKLSSGLHETITCLNDPQFKKDYYDLTNKMLKVVLDDLKNLNEGQESVNFKTLKRELKQAISTIDPEFLAEIDRSSKLAYLECIAEYKTKKIGKVYQLKGEELQGSAKKVALEVRKLIDENRLYEADTLLGAQHHLFKGRISYKKWADVMSLGLNMVGTASAAISIAIALGSLGSPAAPVGIALGVVASVLGLSLAYAKYRQNIKIEENLGITESTLQKNWENAFEKITERNDDFMKNLNPNQKILLDMIGTKIQQNDFDKILYYRFNLPAIDNKASPTDRQAQKAALETAKELNQLIESMNEWAKKRPNVQERVLNKHLAHQLPKINSNTLPPECMEAYRKLAHRVKAKNVVVHELDLVTIDSTWNPEQRAAVRSMNSLIYAIHQTYRYKLETRVSNLEERSAMLVSRIKEDFQIQEEEFNDFIEGAKQSKSLKLQNIVKEFKVNLAQLQSEQQKLRSL